MATNVKISVLGNYKILRIDHAFNLIIIIGPEIWDRAIANYTNLNEVL